MRDETRCQAEIARELDASEIHAATPQARAGIAIAEAQRRYGLPVTGVSSYLPHVTLLHGHAVDAIRESIVPIRWTVREFVLVRCFFGQARQEVVERWPLEPAPAARPPDMLDLSDLPDLADLPEDE